MNFHNRNAILLRLAADQVLAFDRVNGDPKVRCELHTAINKAVETEGYKKAVGYTPINYWHPYGDAWTAYVALEWAVDRPPSDYERINTTTEEKVRILKLAATHEEDRANKLENARLPLPIDNRLNPDVSGQRLKVTCPNCHTVLHLNRNRFWFGETVHTICPVCERDCVNTLNRGIFGYNGGY